MKRIMMTALMATIGLTVQAQRFNIEGALIELNRGNLKEAKEYIDLAADNEATRDNVQMYYVKGDVYLSISTAPDLKDIYPNSGVVALESYINCIKKDKLEKRRRYKDADEKMLNAVVSAYNYGILLYQEGGILLEKEEPEMKEEGKKKINIAVNTWGVVLNSYEFDETRQLEKMNLPKANILQLMADAAIRIGDNQRAFELFETVINGDQPVSYAFARPALLHLELGDTTKALGLIEKGRARFPEDKELITLELMVYQAMGKEDLLTDKITEALNADPENPILLANRGNLYDNRGRAAVEDLKKELEIGYKLQADARKEPNVKKKAAINEEVKASNLRVEEILQKVNRLDSLAVVDYTKAFEIDNSQFEVAFNLGAVYFNGAMPYVEIANNLPADANYEKRYNEQKALWTAKYELALKWFLVAEELQPDNDSVLMSIQQTYAQLGNEAKSMEYKNKREGQ